MNGASLRSREATAPSGMQVPPARTIVTPPHTGRNCKSASARRFIDMWAETDRELVPIRDAVAARRDVLVRERG